MLDHPSKCEMLKKKNRHECGAKNMIVLFKGMPRYLV